MGPTWGPPRPSRPQMGPMLAPWNLLSGMNTFNLQTSSFIVTLVVLRMIPFWWSHTMNILDAMTWKDFRITSPLYRSPANSPNRGKVVWSVGLFVFFFSAKQAVEELPMTLLSTKTVWQLKSSYIPGSTVLSCVKQWAVPQRYLRC